MRTINHAVLLGTLVLVMALQAGAQSPGICTEPQLELDPGTKPEVAQPGPAVPAKRGQVLPPGFGKSSALPGSAGKVPPPAPADLDAKLRRLQGQVDELRAGQ